MDPLLDNSSNLDVTLNGTATLADMDGNGTVDEIERGETIGDVAGSTEPMTVDWTAIYGGL